MNWGCLRTAFLHYRKFRDSLDGKKQIRYSYFESIDHGVKKEEKVCTL